MQVTTMNAMKNKIQSLLNEWLLSSVCAKDVTYCTL